MKITTLGTSHGDHTYCRFNSSTLFEVGDRLYLIDAGAPVNGLLIRSGKQFEKLKAVFITHMHDDHVGGLPGLIKSLIKYPKDEQHTEIFLPEVKANTGLDGWLAAQHLCWPNPLANIKTTHVGKIYNDGFLKVTAVGTRHLVVESERFISFAYILETEGKRIVYTGDLSADFSDFPEVAKTEPCDLCICEATHYDMPSALAELKDYPIKKLVFNHVFDTWHGEGEMALEKMTAELSFPCKIAHDGSIFEL